MPKLHSVRPRQPPISGGCPARTLRPGTILLDGEAEDGGGAVQRRDPLTGRLLATSPQLIGVVEPWIGGVIDSGVWISEASGHMGYAERLDLTTLKPEPLTLPARNPREATPTWKATTA